MTAYSSLIGRAFALITLTAPLASAQQSQSEGQDTHRRAKGRVAYVIYTGGGRFFDKPVTVRSGNKNTAIQLSKRAASPPIKIHPDGKLLFIKETSGDVENPFKIYAKALIPEGMQKSLVVITPSPNSKNGMLFSAKVVNLATFKKGGWLFINLSPRNISVKVGKKKLGLKPGSTGEYDAGKLSKSTNMPVAYAYYHPEKRKWKLLSASTCVIRPTRREICIFSWKPRSSKVDYHGITFVE